MARKQSPEIREFILRNVESSNSVASLAAEKFGLSRTGISRYMARLIEDGLLTAEGNTRARQYKIRPLVEEHFYLERDGQWNEDTIWRERIIPIMKNVKPNIIDLFQYGFTEMLNNVLDHSGSPTVTIAYKQTYSSITVDVIDIGIGIFNKLQHDFKLDDARTALLELTKGKLTSDRKNHSGEGIYFTSRMFDKFAIMSGHLFYTRVKEDTDDWLIESRDKDENTVGTYIRMAISTDADWTVRSVFDKYQGDDVLFRQTHIPIALGKYPGEQLVSRSQAKRILARVTSFSEVILDFKGVAEIGQPFADQIFRVFKNEHPDTALMTVNSSDNINKMIEYVKSNGEASRSPAMSVVVLEK